MNATIDTSTWVAKSTTFSSLHDAWEQICSVSHSERGNLATSRRNKATIHLTCKVEGCPFEFYVSYNKKKDTYLLCQLNLAHTCTGSGRQKQGTVNAASFVEAKVSHSSYLLNSAS
jgi:hypothetical protein